MIPTWVALTTERRRSLARPGSSSAELRFSVSKALVVRRSEAPPEIDDDQAWARSERPQAALLRVGSRAGRGWLATVLVTARNQSVDWLALICERWRSSSPLSAEADPVFSDGPVGVQVSSFER